MNPESFLCSLSDCLEQNAGGNLKSGPDKKTVDVEDVEEKTSVKKFQSKNPDVGVY